jgi:pimeloyl-ACP methyl ester carboxylesterase
MILLLPSGPPSNRTSRGVEHALSIFLTTNLSNQFAKRSDKMSNSMNSMRLAKGMTRFLCLVLLLLACGALSAQNQEHRVRNIVLVHGAWADGSGWKGVYDILVKDGYHVSIVQEPETSFKEDVAATKRTLALQDGPCILVGHSYGGAVITEAGTDSSVAGLVYIAAHMPDAGEKEADDGKRFPSDLSKSGAIKKTADGFTYLEPAQFHEYFAADLSAEQATFMARSQVFNFADNFKASSPPLRGEANEAGCWWREQTERSTQSSNAGMPRAPTATRSKSPAPVTRSTYPGRRRLQL